MRQDFILNDNGSFKVANGDFVVAESNEQHVRLILETNPNEWKASPITGAGLVKNLGGSLTGFAKRNVQVQLEADGYSLDKISENENGLHVTANTI
jgi:hypothetical protein